MKKEYEALMKSLKKRKEELIKAESAHSDEKFAEAEPLHGDEMDIAEATAEQEMNMAMRLRASKEIQRIDDALEKMHHGDYGVCESCGDKIAAKRLKAMPFVQFCLDCQEEMEKDEDNYPKKVSYKMGKFDS